MAVEPTMSIAVSVMSRLKVYTAHPMNGLEPKEVYDYFDGIKERLRDRFIVYQPILQNDNLRQSSDPIKATGYQDPIITDKEIVNRDLWMVRQSDVVLVDLSGTKRTAIGCLFELATAKALRKHTVLVLDGIDGTHHHAFILQSADVVFHDLEFAILYLLDLARGLTGEG